ncbi:MAG: hypothetical protein IKX30_16130 [Victivallales bacterium]|nr:hypothetical protein [Victivallales bacterium]
MKGLLVFGCACCVVMSALAQPRQVKVLDWSWSNPAIDFLEKHLADMQEECPMLDGLVVRVYGQAETLENGKKWSPGTGNAWSKRPWKYEQFAETIARFKALNFGRFTDNFFYMTTNDVDFDWFSDDDFANVAANFGVAAKVAKEIGLKGLGVDIEEYGRKFWNPNDLKTDRPYGEISDAAFRRGQEWGRAVFKEFPDIVLFMPFCLTMDGAALSRPFMNGVIDVMPPEALLYDGHESSGYVAKTTGAYADMQLHLHKLMKKIILPKNVRKARSQILLAPAFYLDGYFNHPATSYYRKALEPEISQLGQVGLFKRCFAAACEEAEPYIWLYGEERCWWKNSPHSRVKGLWDEADGGKGLTQAILEVKNPSGAMIDKPENIVPDFAFTGKEKGWTLWQVEDDRKQPAPGNGEVKNGRCIIRKVSNGCFHQTIPIKPDTGYFFLCRGGVTNDRGGLAGASLCFKNAAGQWLAHTGNVYLKFSGTGDTETVWSFLTTPKDAASVSVQCNAQGQGDGGEAFFTGVLLQEW